MQDILKIFMWHLEFDEQVKHLFLHGLFLL
jgi:hypothetical protein